MKPVETIYNGYRFRSRLEARWACFFDTLNIPYEYEKEGFDLGSTWYLPDFWLPQQQCWVEIKGQQPEEDLVDTSGTWYKAGLLSRDTKRPVHVFAGNVWPTTPGVTFFPLDEQHPVFQPALLKTIVQACGTVEAVPLSSEAEAMCHRIRTSGADAYEQIQALLPLLRPGGCSMVSLSRESVPAWISFLSHGYLAVTPVQWSECFFCGTVSLFWSILDFFPACPCEHTLHTVKSDRIDAAFLAARQARFEYGDRKKHFRVPGFDTAQNTRKIISPQEPHASAQEVASELDKRYFEEHPTQTAYTRLWVEGEFPPFALTSLQGAKEALSTQLGLREDDVELLVEVKVTQIRAGLRQREVQQVFVVPLSPEAAEKLNELEPVPDHEQESPASRPKDSSARALTKKAKKKIEKRRKRSGR